MAERTYTSAIARLRVLPEIFTGSDLTVLFGWKSSIASSYLAQWRKAGLITSLGGRSDVHMNLVRNPHAESEKALRRAFPTAVKVGIDRLRAAGWTTQIAARPEVAIPSTSSRYSVEGFDLVTRPAQWFQTAKQGTEQAPESLDSLRPAWALADMVSRAQDKRVRNAWLPDPDDIELPALGSPAHQDMQAAWRAFGLVPDTMTRSGYADLFDKNDALARINPQAQ